MVDLNLKKTPLYEEHVAQNARIVEFCSWAMPVSYKGLVEEHKCVRNNVGIFDVSHMGEINVTGRGALDFLESLTVNQISKLTIGQAQYNALCNENGMILDDILVYRRGRDSFFLCVNASNIEKMMSWLLAQRPKQGVLIENLSEEYAQIAIQGPKSRDLLSQVIDVKMNELKYYHFSEGKIFGIPSLIARTGYTGELGFEVYLPSSAAQKVWRGLLDAGQAFKIQPCGLGARDTLRLEAGYCLYGNDMDESKTPLQCGLKWITKFNKEHFIGKEALLNQQRQGVSPVLVGFEMLDKAIGRPQYKVYSNSHDTHCIGLVTSGSPSPSLGKNIGFAYVEAQYSKIGT
ncbi:MAG: glycine cleavage system aminomethyltransferase GcvT, partial [Silvanigrellaceae bacterium]|nr:glycine cleavage system aminomethyltransferase GcvT [Silvanigrellaceae bacterium]